MKNKEQHREFLLQKVREQKVDKAIRKIGQFLSLFNEEDVAQNVKHWSQDEEMTETFTDEIECVIQMLTYNKS